MSDVSDIASNDNPNAKSETRNLHRRAPFRWWLLASVAVIVGASVGTAVARANRHAAFGLSSANVVTSNGGTFTRVHSTVAPTFSLVDLENPTQTISLRDFHGRNLIVNFWASWCPPCRKEMPALAEVARELKRRVAFVGLDTQDQRSAGLAFAKSTHVNYPLAFDTAEVWTSYGVYGLPTTFFISPSGRVLGKQVGGLTKSRLLRLIREVFNVSSTQKSPIPISKTTR